MSWNAKSQGNRKAPTFNTSNRKPFTEFVVTQLNTTKSGLTSKKAVDALGNQFKLTEKQELPFSLILGDPEDTEFLRLKPNGTIDPEGQFLHDKLNKQVFDWLRLFLGTEKYLLDAIIFGDGISAWKLIKGNEDGDVRMRLKELRSELKANVLQNPKDYPRYYAETKRIQKAINSIQSVKSVCAEGNLNGAFKNFYMHDDQLKEHFVDDIERVFPEVWNMHLKEPSLAMESLDASKPSMNKMCRALARQENSSEQASFVSKGTRSADSQWEQQEYPKYGGKSNDNADGEKDSWNSWNNGHGAGERTNWEQRHCDNCEHLAGNASDDEKDKYAYLQETHNTKFCFREGGAYYGRPRQARLAERINKMQSSLTHLQEVSKETETQTEFDEASQTRSDEIASRQVKEDENETVWGCY